MRAAGKRGERRPLLKQQQAQSVDDESPTPAPKTKRRNRWFGGGGGNAQQQQQQQQQSEAPRPQLEQPKGHKVAARSASSGHVDSKTRLPSSQPSASLLKNKSKESVRKEKSGNSRRSPVSNSHHTIPEEQILRDLDQTQEKKQFDAKKEARTTSTSDESANSTASSSVISSDEEHAAIASRLGHAPKHRDWDFASDQDNHNTTNITTTSAKDRHEEEKKADEPVLSKKAFLCRPFGRTRLVPSPKYLVQVSEAEWDADELRWKYQITIQQRKHTQAASAPSEDLAFTQAFTWRSLDDFIWLEDNLRLEFQGALLAPLLSIALGTPLKEQQQQNQQQQHVESGPVEASKLSQWLSDILNGIRGEGEWIMSYGPHSNILESEAIEAFLYKSAGPLDGEVLESLPPFLYNGILQQKARGALNNNPNGFKSGNSVMSISGGGQPSLSGGEDRESSFVHQVFHKSLELFPNISELCVGPSPSSAAVVTASPSRASMSSSRRAPKAMQGQNNRMTGTGASKRKGLPYSSRALGTANSLEIMDSFADSASLASPRYSNGLAIHSELIEAEKDLLLNYRITALSAMEKCRALSEAEERVGVAWKKLAISMANIFSYEKDVENAKLGDLKVKKESLPYRKLTKTTVDDCLRVVAKQKSERSGPSIKLLQSMLAAYISDLTSVQPSVDVYFTAVGNLTLLENREEGATLSSQRESKMASKSSKSQRSGLTEEEIETIQQKRLYQQRVLIQERYLCESLTQLCKATPARSSRMSWWYMRTEAAQCAALHAAAASLRTKCSVSSKDVVSKMIRRHFDEQKVDDVTEIQLTERILKLRKSKIINSDESSSFDSDEKTEEEEENDQEVEAMREQARQHVKKRLGRWDAKVGWAVMEAVGIDDPIVRMEEATRDLKLINKYAVGLQECLNRCVEAVEHVRSAIKVTNEASETTDLRDIRKSLMVETSKLFSGRFMNHDERISPRSATPSMSILSRAGVEMGDPFGWTVPLNTADPPRDSRKKSSTCVGELFFSYLNSRDTQTEWLLDRLSDLLQEYQERVETVEGYLYMQCVGIKIEKYFNEKRSKALTAFERKTDISSAMNVATRKKMPHLVKELQAKLDSIGSVSHTVVKQTKELHLESKQLKSEISDLAVRRLLRARETSTEKAIALMSFWAKEEESCCASELKALGEAISALEKQACEK